MTTAEKRGIIDSSLAHISISRQCALLGLPRSSFYSQVKKESPENLLLMRMIDEEYTRHPFYGSRKMSQWLKTQGFPVNRKRARRLVQQMGLEAVYRKPNLSRSAPDHKKYPYLLRGLNIDRPNLVWSTDITYIRMKNGFMYLTAILDWYSRYVLAWRLSNSLDKQFCLDALDEAFRSGIPIIFNTDQGVQFTSAGFVEALEAKGIKVSMDGKGRAIDNVFIERLWRSVKYELVYLNEYETANALQISLESYFHFYNQERLHQSLKYSTPEKCYKACI